MLLFAVLLTGASCILPFAYDARGAAFPMLEWPVLLIINATATLLCLIDIFCYRNLRFQMRLATMVMLLQVVVFGYGLGIFFKESTGELTSALTGLPFTGTAFVLTWFAHRFMKKDKDLLDASNRLR